MAILEIANGLALHQGYLRNKIPMFFDDNYDLIVAPNQWIIFSVAKRGSRSEKTSSAYAWILNRFLKWLDHNIPEGFDSPLGAQNWYAVDVDIFDEYLLHLSQPDQTSGILPEKNTLINYAYRIWDFYQWAESVGYTHYLQINTQDVERRLEHQVMLTHINSKSSSTKVKFNLPLKHSAMYQKEVEKFVNQSDYEAALKLLSDPAYQIIATIIRIVGLRPRDLLHQLPYRGNNINSGFIPYDVGSIPEDLDRRTITYNFKSKGKVRTIEFPGKLWRVICECYIPLRRERAKLFSEKYGQEPSNKELFLSAEGKIINYRMLYYNFSRVVKVSQQGDNTFKGRSFNARMLRHTCATYFVYEALLSRDRLGSNYVYDAALDEALRKLLGHEDIGTTLKYYVHLVNRFVRDDLLSELHASSVDQGISAILKARNYHY